MSVVQRAGQKVMRLFARINSSSSTTRRSVAIFAESMAQHFHTATGAFEEERIYNGTNPVHPNYKCWPIRDSPNVSAQGPLSWRNRIVTADGDGRTIRRSPARKWSTSAGLMSVSIGTAGTGGDQ